MTLPQLFTGLGLCWPWVAGWVRERFDLRGVLVAGVIWLCQAVVNA